MIGDIGIKAELMQAHDTIASLREQRDAERGEVARLRGRLEMEMANTDQLKAANAVVEAITNDAINGQELGRRIQAYRATQKGGAK